MFSTFKEKLVLGIYIFIIISIPIGSYLVSQYQTIKSSASEPKTSKRPLNSETPPPISNPSNPSAQKLQILKETVKSSPAPAAIPSASPSPSEAASTASDTTSTTIPTSFGPTLSLKAILEGRPADNQSTKLFVGIMEGAATSNPKFLLNFTIDLPKSGQYDNLSLAGLTTGNKYTAVLKGPSQLAGSASFTMSPTVTKLNDGNPVTLLTGDLNEDNVVNGSDYTIEQKVLGAVPGSANWNDNLDFNKDGVINAFDLGYITRNFGKTGDTGTWYSPIPGIASSSASLKNDSSNKPQGGNEGYWIWVPK